MGENDDDSKRSRSSGHSFTDNLWGKRARVLVQSTQQLKESNWVQIEAHASACFQGADHNDEENGGETTGVVAGVDMYAQIEIDWYVPLTLHSVNDTNVSLE